MRHWMVKVNCWYRSLPDHGKLCCDSVWMILEAENADIAMKLGGEFAEANGGIFNKRPLSFEPMEAISMTLPVITKRTTKKFKSKPTSELDQPKEAGLGTQETTGTAK